MNAALQSVGVDSQLVSYKDIGDPDILFLASVGVNGENGKSAAKANETRFQTLDRYYGKIPFVLAAHDVTELSTFRKSRDYFQDKVFDAILPVGESEAMMDSLRLNFRSKHIYCVRHPFKFDDSLFKDRSEFSNNVCSSSRIAGAKRTDIILKLATISEKNISIWSAEKGVYWYHAIKTSPLYDQKYFRGAWVEQGEPYLESAFCIDLTLFLYSKGDLFDGNRTQYSIIEAIESGSIPIGFDCWKYPEGYEGIWLPTPKRKGRKLIWEIEKYNEIINSAEYDFEMAKRNKQRLSEACEYSKIGWKVKNIFQGLLIGAKPSVPRRVPAVAIPRVKRL